MSTEPSAFFRNSLSRAEREALRIEKEARGFQAVNSDGPKLAYRNIWRNMQLVVVGAVQRFADGVVKRGEVETASAQLRRRAI